MIMTMTPDEKFNQDVWRILQRIREFQLYFAQKDGGAVFTYSTPEWYDEKIMENAVLKRLEEWGAIEHLKEEGVFASFKIAQQGFEELYNDYKNRAIGKSVPKGEIKFDDNKPALFVDGIECPLPAYKNEHFFCRAMLKYPVGESVDWSYVYKEMTGKEPESVRGQKEKRTVYDTYEALNTRVRKILGIEKLFVWEGKTIKRTQ